MSAVTTHVLDAARGRPAAGVAVCLEADSGTQGSGTQDFGTQDSGTQDSDTQWTQLAESATNADGRIGELGPHRLEPGEYRLTFATGEYFDALGTESFYPRVQINFRITDPEQHYHVPLLLSPFSYSTYRGS